MTIRAIRKDDPDKQIVHITQFFFHLGIRRYIELGTFTNVCFNFDITKSVNNTQGLESEITKITMIINL